MESGILNILSSGVQARLIPTIADSQKEERATSCLLASFMVVPTYARDVLSEAGAPVGKRINLSCYTEIIFKSNEKGKKPRPDGLVVIDNGNKKWTALIESKIGNSELTQEQVEEYLDLAKQHGVNALITISNQFATTPTHHPVKVSKTKTRSVELYHFSWLSLVSKAVLLCDNKRVDDPEQAYILSELVRYLRHNSSGVSSLTRMHGDWKEACRSIQQGTPLVKGSDTVENSVASWHQLLRHLALNLSMKIGQPVTISLSRARKKDAEINFQEDCTQLVKGGSLEAEFDIPNAAAKLAFSSDFLRRTINISMRLEAPKDKSRATASINWLTRQLRSGSPSNVVIKVHWPKRIPLTAGQLTEVTENPSEIIPPGVSELPTFLEVTRVIDLVGRFKGAKTFVEDASREFPLFYHDVGQHLSKWVARAPKVKEPESDTPSIPTIFSGPVEFISPENNNRDEPILSSENNS